MIWDLEDWDSLTRRICGDVLLRTVMEPRTPRSLTPVHHGTYALGRRLPLPRPREGIGVGDPTPSPHTDSCHSPSPNR